MAKSSDPESDQLKELLIQINDRISSAKVLNGGFDRLEKEVAEIKKMQTETKLEIATSQVNQERMEGKLDRLYDPEDGIYAKVQKTEMLIGTLGQKMTSLSDSDKELKSKLDLLDEKAQNVSSDIEKLKTVTGDDLEHLSKSIRISKGFIWLSGITLAGFLSALGKFLWDFLAR